MFGCMFQAPSENNSTAAPFKVSLIAGRRDDHCMSASGIRTPVEMEVGPTRSRLTCSPVGYIETKSSSTRGDTCHTDKSWWTLSYKVADSDRAAFRSKPENFARFRVWGSARRENEITLVNEVDFNVYICPWMAHCEAREYMWPKKLVGKAYVGCLYLSSFSIPPLAGNSGFEWLAKLSIQVVFTVN